MSRVDAAARRAAAASVRALPAGRGVVLRGSSASVHEVARAARVRIVRELIALPSATTPAYLVDDDAAPLTLLCTELLSVPPGLVRLAGPGRGAAPCRRNRGSVETGATPAPLADRGWLAHMSAAVAAVTTSRRDILDIVGDPDRASRGTRCVA